MDNRRKSFVEKSKTDQKISNLKKKDGQMFATTMGTKGKFSQGIS